MGLWNRSLRRPSAAPKTEGVPAAVISRHDVEQKNVGIFGVRPRTVSDSQQRAVAGRDRLRSVADGESLVFQPKRGLEEGQCVGAIVSNSDCLCAFGAD